MVYMRRSRLKVKTTPTATKSSETGMDKASKMESGEVSTIEQPYNAIKVAIDRSKIPTKR